MEERIIKIKASTLVETLVAMTILSLISGMAITIFIAVSAPGSSSGPMLLAQQKSREMMEIVDPSALQDGFRDTETVVSNLWFYQSVSDYAPGLKEVVIEVTGNNDKVIYTRKKLFYVPEK